MQKTIYKIDKNEQLKIIVPLRLELAQLKKIEGDYLRIEFPVIISFDDPDKGE